MDRAAPARRVLITGVAHRLGGRLAQRLEDRSEVDAIYGIDISEPSVALGRTEFVRADTRHALIAKLIRELEVDTVVHCGVVTHWARASRAVHETNVIGTMNVLAACSGDDNPVRRVVVKSGVAVYGIEPHSPSFLTENLADGARPGGALARDLHEMEQMIRDFAIRHRRVGVTVLRLGEILGGTAHTPLAAYFNLPVIPTVLGFDPRLQLLHADDAVEALFRAAVAPHPGVYNVAGDGILLLSQAVALTGRRTVPVLPPFMALANRVGVRLLTGLEMPDHLVDLLTYGRVVDTSRIESEFGWRPAHSTRAVMLDFINRQRDQEPPEFRASPPQERELDQYLRRRRRSGHLRMAP